MGKVTLTEMREEIRDLAANRIPEGSYEQRNAVEKALSLAMESTKKTSDPSYLDEKMLGFMQNICAETEEQKLGGSPAFCEVLPEYKDELGYYE